MAKDMSFPDFLREVAIPMFGFAIVNPMGPTFLGFAIGKKTSGEANLLFFSLNPFSQTARELTTYNFDPHNVALESLVKDHGIYSDIDQFLSSKKSNGEAFGTPTMLFGTLDTISEEEIDQQRLITLSILKMLYC